MAATNWISFASPMMDALMRPFDPSADDLHCLYAFPPPPPPMLVKDLAPSPAEAAAAGSLISFASPATPAASEAAVVPAVGPPAQRTSVYRGVTKHRWTGRYEAHLWDNTCRREGQKRKGRQVYLGGYDREEKAARAYDLAALKYWGPAAATNFPAACYDKEIEEMKCMSKQEFIASIRRRSSGFSRGASIYRGVTRHHQHGRWQARIGRVAGNKDLYLGTFSTEEEAAEAYDVAAIKFRGVNAVTNFELNRYDVEAIANSDLPIGASAKRIKQALQADSSQLLVSKFTDPQNLNSQTPVIPANLLQLQCSPVPLCSLPYCNEVDIDMCGQNIYFLPPAGPNKSVPNTKQMQGSCTLMLTHFTSSDH